MDWKKWDQKKIAAAAFCVFLLVLNLWQLHRISELKQAVWSVQNNVVNQVSQIGGQVSSLRYDMDHAEDQVQDWTYTTAINRETRNLDVAVSVVLKEWQADTAAELLWTNENVNGGEDSVPLTSGGAGAFTGTLELPLTGLSGEITLDVKITNGETMRRESLGYLGEAATLLPVHLYGYGIVGPALETKASQPGAVTVSDCDVNLEGFRGESLPDLSGQVFRLRRNGEIAAEKTAMYGETIGQYTCEEMSVEVQPGDELELTFFCRDSSGLGYEFSIRGWIVNENGVGEQASPEESWPELTWD